VIAVSQETELGALAAVTFSNAGRTQTVKYRLVKAAGQWKIYDIDWGGGHSLRKLFSP
jgi:hypothetical protein